MANKTKPNHLFKTLGLSVKEDYRDHVIKIFKCSPEKDHRAFYLRVYAVHHTFVDLDFKGLEIQLSHTGKSSTGEKGEYSINMVSDFLSKPHIINYKSQSQLLYGIVSAIESEIGLKKLQKEFNAFKKNCVNLVPIDILTEPNNELYDGDFYQDTGTSKPRHCLYEAFEEEEEDLMPWSDTSNKFASDYDSELDTDGSDLHLIDVDLSQPCIDMDLRFNYRFCNHNLPILANTYPYSALIGTLTEDDIRNLLPKGFDLQQHPMLSHDVFDPKLFLLDAFSKTKGNTIDYPFTLYVSMDYGGTIVEGKCLGVNLSSKRKAKKNVIRVSDITGVK